LGVTLEYWRDANSKNTESVDGDAFIKLNKRAATLTKRFTKLQTLLTTWTPPQNWPEVLRRCEDSWLALLKGIKKMRLINDITLQSVIHASELRKIKMKEIYRLVVHRQQEFGANYAVPVSMTGGDK